MRIVNIIITALILCVSVGCSDSFLENDLYSSVNYKDNYKTPADLHNAVMGVYNVMTGANYYGRSMMIYGELRSDNLHNGRNGGRYTRVSDFTLNDKDGDVWGTWSTIYNCIGKCNDVINNKTVKENKEVLFYKAQAKALRALFYFDLHRLYGQEYCADSKGLSVPIQLNYMVTENPNPAARATIEEVKDRILQDLQEAYVDIKFGSAPKYEMNPLAAIGLYARVCLYFGDYPNARKYAKEVIDAEALEIVDPKLYPGQWKIQENGETLFELAFTDTDNLGTNAYPYLYEKAGYNQMSFTPDVLNLYNENDIRHPYIGRDADAKRLVKFPETTQADIPTRLIRYPEILLIYAESCIRTSTEESTAMTLINEYLAKRNTGETLVEADFTVEKIMLERRKEFVGEGFRYYDLLRTSNVINIYTDEGSLVMSLDIPDNKLVFPIPSKEINANQNIAETDQNPGY